MYHEIAIGNTVISEILRERTSEEAFNYLKRSGYLDYGMTIPKEEIENALGMRYSDTMDYIGKYLELKKYIEDKGYFCTQRRCEKGCMRILPLESMCKESSNRQTTWIKKQKRTIRSMIHANISNLIEIERERHLLEVNKLAMGIQAIKSVLASF